MANIVFIDIGKSVKVSFGERKGDYGFMELEIPKSSTSLIVEEDNIHLTFYSNGDRITIDFNNVDSPADSIDASDLGNKLSDLFFKESVNFDIDALIYFNAVIANGGALSILEKAAYNVYRISSKENANPWNSLNYLDLPMIGGSVESMVINAKNPGTFDAIAVNTVSGDFTTNGWKPNGTDSYLRMILIAADELTIQSIGLEYYSRTNIQEAGCDIGAMNNSTDQVIQFFIRHTPVKETFFDCYGGANGRVNVDQDNAAGGFMATRVASNDSKVFRNGVEYGAITTSLGTQTSFEFYLGARNNLGVADTFSTKENAGAGIYDGLTAAKVLSQYNARQTLNTTLSRQV